MERSEAKLDGVEQIQIVRNSVIENTLSNPALITDTDCKKFIFKRGKGWVCEINNHIVVFSIVDLEGNKAWALFLQPKFERQGIDKQIHEIMVDWYFAQN
ncbi:hypothetical protein [Salmonirosea aquatica]|uniref:GNAT family N-acetyltransferase n=1 Tax=Salmonirosea aquatica TaxID=2654236 RepID=A0A7C9BEN0_9BACT|nr:hypothetical protein [Cytophagaceae bacterium SJW1-29]